MEKEGRIMISLENEFAHIHIWPVPNRGTFNFEKNENELKNIILKFEILPLIVP